MKVFTSKSTSIVEEKKDEQQLWFEMDPFAWHNSIAKGSIFQETYDVTRSEILDFAKSNGNDVIIEVGCGTGDVIGNLVTDIPRYGLDFNESFIHFCKTSYEGGVTFVELDARFASRWFESLETNYEKPLVVCVNNTLNIMPPEIRGQIVQEMLNVAGQDGDCLLTYWNGHFFSHAVVNYYKDNADLCGEFEYSDVNWQTRTLETPSGYTTHWLLPDEVQRLLRSYDINIDLLAASSNRSIVKTRPHIISTRGLAIFAWFSAECTSNSKSYYDSDDAQTFYSKIWGDETVHIGRYDLLSPKEETSLSMIEQISRAQEVHEVEFLQRIHSKFCHTDDSQENMPRVRVLDMGCGYGGLLRRMWKADMVWRAVGCDISTKMCQKAIQHNAKIGADQDIAILEESYLSVSIPNESMDLVISEDALLHIGPQLHEQAAKEAARVLRPGGWMIFCDIMQHETVDPQEMQPIYDRIHLSKMGTPSNYKQCLEAAGFSKFEFEPHSSNITRHYQAVKQVLLEMKDELDVSPQFLERMAAGLDVWSRLAPKNIQWGFMMAQKTSKA